MSIFHTVLVSVRLRPLISLGPISNPLKFHWVSVEFLLQRFTLSQINLSENIFIQFQKYLMYFRKGKVYKVNFKATQLLLFFPILDDEIFLLLQTTTGECHFKNYQTKCASEQQKGAMETLKDVVNFLSKTDKRLLVSFSFSNIE